MKVSGAAKHANGTATILEGNLGGALPAVSHALRAIGNLLFDVLVAPLCGVASIAGINACFLPLPNLLCALRFREILQFRIKDQLIWSAPVGTKCGGGNFPVKVGAQPKQKRRLVRANKFYVVLQ